MFCPNCGHQIPDDALFCPDCGQSTQPAARPAAPASEPSPAQPQPQANPAQPDPAAQQPQFQANPAQPDPAAQQPPVFNGEPMGQQTAYQYQYSMQYAPDARRMNGLCVAGLVVGIVSIFFYVMGITGIVAVVLSALGLSSSAKHNQRGRGLAIAGLVLGIVSTVLGVVFICTCASSYFLAYL